MSTDPQPTSAGGPDTADSLRARLRVAEQHAHQADAARADAEVALLTARADLERARAREARALTAAVTDRAALDAVRRLCHLTIEGSGRVQAREQAQDTLTAIDHVTAGAASPGDGAWNSVWLHGKWRYLTSKMSTPEREHAADAVARWGAAAYADDTDIEPGEPEGLRWWRD